MKFVWSSGGSIETEVASRIEESNQLYQQGASMLPQKILKLPIPKKWLPALRRLNWV